MGLNLLDHISADQTGGDRILKNLRFAVQKLVNCSKHSNAQSSSAGIALWHRVAHDVTGVRMKVSSLRRLIWKRIGLHRRIIRERGKPGQAIRAAGSVPKVR